MDNNDLKEALKFLRRVLPTGHGYSYFVTLDLPGQRPPNHQAFDTSGLRDTLDKLRKQTNKNPTNGTFFTPFIFSDKYHPEGGNLRKHDDYKVACKCLWVDIDVGEGKHYPTLRDALTALLSAVGDRRPNIMVNTGGGVHAYWVLDQDVPHDRWLMVARRMKQWLSNIGVKGDLGITPDSGRVLRVPFTPNMKTGTPRVSKVVHDDLATTALAMLESDLPEISNLEKGVPAGAITSLFGAPTETMVEEAERRPSYTEEIVKKCLIINATGVSRGKDDNEPLWKDVLGVIARTEDAEAYAHVFSDGHPDYHETFVNQKLVERGEHKPITCSQLRDSYMECHGTDLCASCPHNGTIKSPITLGYRETEPEEVPTTLPFPLELRADGTYLHTKDKDGRRGTEQIMPNRLLSARAVRGKDDDGNYVQRLVCEVELHGVSEERALDMVELSQHRSKKCSHFIDNGMMVKETIVDTVSNGVKSWYNQLVEAGKAVDPVLRLGWYGHTPTLGYAGFATGGDVMIQDPNGEAPYLKIDDPLINSYKQYGDPLSWGRCVETLMSSGIQELMVPVYASFASILTPFNPDPSAVVNIFTEQSGVGKTTAMQVAASVWGNYRAITNSMNDTVNAVANRASVIHNLPLFWDEVRGGDEHDRQMMEFIFRIPQGRSKERMTGGGGATNTYAEYKLMAVLASNQPIITNAMDSGEDAAVARIFSVELPRDIKFVDSQNRHVFGELVHNYGHAGVDFAQYVAEHQKECRALCKKLDDALRAKHKPKAGDRMLLTAMAQLAAAACLLKAQGIVNNDPRAFLACMEHHYLENLKLHKRMATQTRTVVPVEQYMNDSRVNGMVVTELPKSRPGKPKDREDKVVQPPLLGAGSLNYELCSKTGEAILNRSHFQQWAVQNIPQFKAGRWERQAEGEGVLLDRNDRRSLGAGTRHTTKTQHFCYHVQLPDVGTGGRLNVVPDSAPASDAAGDAAL